MALATGIGSHPGEDQHAFDEAVRVVLGELPDLAYVPEVPGRGVTAAMTGRALGVVTELGVDLQPSGWRLTGPPSTSGVDHRRARSLLAQDLDTFEEGAQGFAGTLKVQVAGPWTLAATVEKPRGDRVLSDVGARRELAQALAEAVREHAGDVRRRVPGAARVVVQVDEPALAAVLAGSVPTASGFHRHRSVEPPEATETLGWVLAAVTDAGAEPWVHSCAPDTPLDVLRRAGARGLAVDLSVLGPADHDQAAEALEAGETLALGVVPSADPATPPTAAQVTEAAVRWLDMVGLDPDVVGDRLVLTPACGLAGGSPGWAQRSLALLRDAAGHLSG
jgi:methionine synthase II (cobalamin-independent)